MNKYKHSLEKLRVLERQSNFERCLDIAPQIQCDVLQELVDRATPKKPTEKLIEVYCGEIPNEKELHYYCPICGYWVGDGSGQENYCPNCGQAID